MSNQEENNVEKIQNEDTFVCTNEEGNAVPNNKNETKMEKNSRNESDNTNVEQVSDSCKNTEQKSSSTALHNIPSSFHKEKPKVNYKKNDDGIEEFDTDEEEEEEENKLKEQHSYTNNITYEGDKCIYTEPGTGRKLVWNSKENKWCPDESSDNQNIENPIKNYEFDGKNYVYTDETTNVTYKFIQEKNEWVVKNDDKSKDENVDTQKVSRNPTTEGVYGFENDTHTYTDPSDGTSYFWDREKNAWFPKVDDDFMARYQMNYGFTDASNANTTSNVVSQISSKKIEAKKAKEDRKLSKDEKKVENKRKAQEPPTWFDVDEAHNTTIYLANLPYDVTMDELKELVTKCGLLARDEKGNDKIKLYVDSNGELKGDARCTYIKVESVNLALNILDGWKIRGKTLSVTRAKFQLKGEYNPSLKPKRKKNYKDKQKKIHEKLLDWRPDKLPGEPLKHERIVIIKNLFQPQDFDKDVTLILEYQQDIRSECLKCGEVKKVTIYDRHPEGVAQVTFKEPEEAQACIQLLNGRWFGQRRITAEIWDGKTKYKIRETEEQIEARINEWDKFLEEQDEAEEENKKKAHEQDKKSVDIQNTAEKSQTEGAQNTAEKNQTKDAQNTAEKSETEEKNIKDSSEGEYK